jgi:hypothetical protein
MPVARYLSRPCVYRKLDSARRTGLVNVALHASALRNPSQPQLELSIDFFLSKSFVDLESHDYPNCKLPTGPTTYHVVSRSLHKRWETSGPPPDERFQTIRRHGVDVAHESAFFMSQHS